jgi:hypothetical protein
MFKRAMSIVLILVLLPQFTGCITSVKAVNLTDVERPGSEDIHGVITLAGEQVDFDRPSTEVHNDTIYAAVDQNACAIALDEVQQLRLKRPDAGRTALGIAFVAIVIAATVAIVGSSGIGDIDTGDWDWGGTN